MARRFQRSLLLVGLAAVLGSLASIGTAQAETCMSPFVKRLDRPEKYLYVFCLAADGKKNDVLTVIDVDRKSTTYGKPIHILDLGSGGNETHHFGYTDDRTHIWGCSLFSSKIFIINVSENPAKPKVVKVLNDVPDKSGFAGPHSPYAVPGRMLISFLSNKNGDVPAGLAEYKNDGTFLRSFDLPRDAPYMYDVAINPDLNRMVTSSFTPMNNYKKPLAKMDFKHFGKELLIWDYRKHKVLQKLTTGGAPLECRWSLKKENNYGFTNCALDDSIWVWEGGKDDTYTTRKLMNTGKLPADLRQSPDDRYLYVSCFGSDEVQQWDVSDLKNPKLHSTLKPGVHPNMMHVTGDGKRMYITNSLLSTADRSDQFWVKLAHINADGMKLDESFFIDLTKLSAGAMRGHDMLLN
jgi:selenium-binding protein 1